MLNYDGDKKGKSLTDAIEKKIQSMDLNLTARVEAMAAAPAAVVKKQLEEAAEELNDKIDRIADDLTANDLAYRAMFDELGIDPDEAEELIREMESEIALSKEMSSSVKNETS